MSWNNEEGGNSESEEEYEDSDRFGGREALIFLVDAFLFNESQRFKDCVEIIRSALVNGLLTRDKDLIGVVFCNTDKNPDPKDTAGIQNIYVPDHTAVLLPLRQLSKDIVNYFLNFATPDYFDFGSKYGVAEGNFDKAIWLCTKMFSRCGHKLANSSILLFTDREHPHPTNPDLFQLAIQKAKDLEETGVNFSVVPMSEDFDYEAFYKEFICVVRDMDLEDFAPPDVAEEKKMIRYRQARQDKKRCNVHLKWTLGDGVQLSVGLYNYYKRNVYPKSVKLLREDNSVIDCKRVHKIGILDPETKEVENERYCKPGDERKTITVGGEKITFTSEELAKLRSPLEPGLTLLGFKPRSCVSWHNFVKSSAFLYPNEKTIEGSTQLFRALWERCIAREKVAICVIVTRRKVPPHYIALVPTRADDEEVHTPIQNDGFQAVYLPFEIDYREVDLSEWTVPEISDSDLEMFRKILKKLRLRSNFSPTMFKDPHLENLLDNIAAMALDVELEKPDFEGIPNIDQQTARIHPYVEQIINSVGQDPQAAPKRKADGDAGVQQVKAPKITDDHLSKEQISRLIETNGLSQLSVKQLKTYLQDNNVKGISTAKKDTLIEKVIELHS